MDWSKAKNILIVAFTITNIILLIVLGKDMINNNSNKIDKDFISNVRVELLKKNIVVECDIPNRIPSLTLLTLRYEAYDPYNLAKRMLKGNEFDSQNYGNKVYFQNPSEILTVYNKNKIVYGTKDRNKIYEKVTRQTAEEIAINFLNSNNFKNDYKLIEYNEIDGVHTLIFKPIYKNILIENEEIFMKFEIDNSGIKRFERTWIEVVRLKEREIKISSAPDTLLKLLSQSKYFGKNITDIEICYKFDGDSITTKEEDAYPAWRIKFNDNTIVILK